MQHPCWNWRGSLFSDGKLNFTPKHGKTDLTEFMDIKEANALIEETEKIFEKFGMDGKIYPTSMEESNPD